MRERLIKSCNDILLIERVVQFASEAYCALLSICNRAYLRLTIFGTASTKQGLHQDAQKSTMMGTSLANMASKLSSVPSIGYPSSREDLHLPHCGSSLMRVVGTLLSPLQE